MRFEFTMKAMARSSIQDQQYRDGSSAEQSARYAAEELAWSRKSSYPREFFS
jgi:hypothetical protein